MIEKDKMIQINKIIQIFRWLLPTGVGLVIYSILALLTMLYSNISSIKGFIPATTDLHAKSSALGGIDNFLSGILGEQAPAALVTGVFWALVGAIVYGGLLLTNNFFLNVKQDLDVQHQVYPTGTDRFYALKLFLEDTGTRLVCTIGGIIYVNMVLTVLLPIWENTYAAMFSQWPNAANISAGLVVFLQEIIIFHGLVIILRLALHRTRIFSM
jgi:hypothetical protein